MSDQNRRKAEAEAEEDMIRRYSNIPDERELQEMPYVLLSDAFRLCEKGSTKFHVIEREMKKRLAKDQAKINLPNMLCAACVGGVFALIGVLLGYWLKNDVPHTSPEQKIEKRTLTPSAQSGNPAFSKPPVIPPAVQPAPLQSNAQSSKANP